MGRWQRFVLVFWATLLCWQMFAARNSTADLRVERAKYIIVVRVEGIKLSDWYTYLPLPGARSRIALVDFRIEQVLKGAFRPPLKQNSVVCAPLTNIFRMYWKAPKAMTVWAGTQFGQGGLDVGDRWIFLRDEQVRLPTDVLVWSSGGRKLKPGDSTVDDVRFTLRVMHDTPDAAIQKSATYLRGSAKTHSRYLGELIGNRLPKAGEDANRTLAGLLGMGPQPRLDASARYAFLGEMATTLYRSGKVNEYAVETFPYAVTTLATVSIRWLLSEVGDKPTSTQNLILQVYLPRLLGEGPIVDMVSSPDFERGRRKLYRTNITKMFRLPQLTEKEKTALRRLEQLLQNGD